MQQRLKKNNWNKETFTFWEISKSARVGYGHFTWATPSAL